MFNALRNLLGRAGQTVHSAESAVLQSPIAKAIESQIPFIPQTALAPESLRPNQQAGDYQSPFNVHGQQPNVGWKPNFPSVSNSIQMPGVLGLPDYTATSNFDFSHPRVPADSAIPSRGTWQPKAQLIQPALPPTPNDSYKSYPRFQS